MSEAKTTSAVDALISRAASAELAGRADEAASMLADALRIDPNHPSALTFGALLWLRGGRVQLAFDYAERAVAADPQRARSQHLRGLALQASGRGDEAIAGLRRAVALDAGLVDARLDLANALLEAGELAAAQGEIDAALAAQPTSAIAWNSLGNLRARRREFDGAIAAYRQAIALDPKLPQAYGNLGMLKAVKDRRPDLQIVMSGCLAQNEEDAIRARLEKTTSGLAFAR